MTITRRVATLSAAALLSALPMLTEAPASAMVDAAPGRPTAQGDGCSRTLPVYPNLEPGARRPAVRTLQCSLNDVGVGPVVVDGFYGKQTRAAVVEIKKGYEGQGEPHPGRVNNGFWTLLFGRQLPERTLQLGDHGHAVKVLQRALRAAGGDLVVDGGFGRQTESVVEVYQRELDIRVTGRVDDNTRFILGMGGVIGELS